MTSSHVVRGNEHPEVYLYNRQHDPLQATVLDKEEDDLKGFALLMLNSREIDSSGLASLSLGDTAQLKGREDITIIGFSNSTAMWTVIASTVARIDGRNLVISGAIQQGNSGGPAILNGRVVGLVTDVSQGFTHAAKSESVVTYVNGLYKDLVTPAEGTDAKAAAEAGIWKAAQDSNTSNGYEMYLRAYPNGRYVVEDRDRQAGCWKDESSDEQGGESDSLGHELRSPRAKISEEPPRIDVMNFHFTSFLSVVLYRSLR